MNYLQRSIEPVADGIGGLHSLVEGELDTSMFETMQPVATIGYTIYIYHITELGDKRSM